MIYGDIAVSQLLPPSKLSLYVINHIYIPLCLARWKHLKQLSIIIVEIKATPFNFRVTRMRPDS
jgi:hypothetical protein